MIERMEEIAEECVKKTGFFHAGRNLYRNIMHDKGEKDHKDEKVEIKMQSGVVRTNCIDSLDRTNAAQFFIGKCALGHQLYSMGITDTPYVAFDTDIVDKLVDMYEGMGNQIALQYAGSELVNTIKSYRSGNIVTHSRDLFTTVKRYYSNSFTDAEKQQSINLFLGNFIPHVDLKKTKEHLWDLETDFPLHNKNVHLYRPPEHFLLSNTKWWQIPLQEFSHTHSTDSSITPSVSSSLALKNAYTQFFTEYYKPQKLTSFDRTLTLGFNSPIVPVKSIHSRTLFLPSNLTSVQPSSSQSSTTNTNGKQEKNQLLQMYVSHQLDDTNTESYTHYIQDSYNEADSKLSEEYNSLLKLPLTTNSTLQEIVTPPNTFKYYFSYSVVNSSIFEQTTISDQDNEMYLNYSRMSDC